MVGGCFALFPPPPFSHTILVIKHTYHRLVPESASDEYLETVVDYSEALIKNKQCDAAVALLSHAIRLANGKPGKAIFVCPPPPLHTLLYGSFGHFPPMFSTLTRLFNNGCAQHFFGWLIQAQRSSQLFKHHSRRDRDCPSFKTKPNTITILNVVCPRERGTCIFAHFLLNSVPASQTFALSTLL